MHNKNLVPCATLLIAIFYTPLGFSQTESEDQEQAEEDTIEVITVTGSRIKKTNFSSSSPLEIINTGDSALAGLLSASDILQNSTLASGQQLDSSFSAFVVDGGPGVNQISLRGLGAQRSLVLVNGKRWVPSGVGGATYAVDLNSIPDVIVDRYEILKDGASSIYGADAVAGVVNIITEQSFSGGKFALTLERPQHIAQNGITIDAVVGKTGSNWTFSASGSMESYNAIKQSELRYAECDTRPRLTDPDDDGVIDNTDPETGENLCFGQIQGFVVSPFGWARYDPSLANPDPDSPNYDSAINGDFGIPYYTRVPTSDLDNAGEFYRDERNPSVNDLEPETKIYSLNSQGTLDLSLFDRDSTAYFELYHNRRKNTVNSGYRQIFPFVSADNPYNPFGIYGPLGEENGSPVTPVLPSYEIENPVADINVALTQLFVGLKGDIAGSWTYDAYLGYGRSKGTYHSEALLEDRLNAALDAEIVDGEVVCRDLEAFPDCQPVNLFSEDALIHGRLPSATKAFLTKQLMGKTTYDSKILSAYATGDLFYLPGGSAAAVIGLEARKESIDDQPDEESINDNIYATSTAGISKGADEIKEAFAELELPLLASLPGIEQFDLKIAGRYTDYKSFGYDTTYQIGADWSVTHWLRFRGTMGTSFRAPDLYEQFLADQTGFVDGFLDPCKTYLETADPGDPIYDNCARFDFPEEYFLGGRGIMTISGGSSSLQAETSDSSTYGIVIHPESIDLQFGITWWDFSIKNTITRLSASSILAACYNSSNFSHPFCSRIAPRNEDFDIPAIDSSFLNVGEQASKGYDIDISYLLETPSVNYFFDLNATYTDELSEQILQDIYNYEGFFAVPYWRADLHLQADWRNWIFAWSVQWIGKTREANSYDPGTQNNDRITWTNDEYYHTVSAFYDSGNVKITGTIKNLFDEDPPLVADGSGSASATRVFNTLPGAGYNLIGRSFILSAEFALD